MKFMILTTKYESNPKATACKGFEKFMSVKKISVRRKVSVAKFCCGISRYFAKQQEIHIC